MSQYCGKCDLWDSLVMIKEVNDETTDWGNIKICQISDDSYFDENGWNNVGLLDIKCLKDLLPYAAYIVNMVSWGKDYCIVYIGAESYVQQMERKKIEWAVRDLKCIYRKYKRKKIDFNVDDMLSEIWNPSELDKQVAQRIMEHPTSFKTDDLKVLICEYYKANLYDDMIKEGYSENEAYEWCYNNKKTW
jgi:hypothetical protein